MNKVFFPIIFIFLGGTHKAEASGIVHDPTSYAQQTTMLQQATENVKKATEQILSKIPKNDPDLGKSTITKDCNSHCPRNGKGFTRQHRTIWPPLKD